MGSRLFFDGKTLLSKLPEAANDKQDGSAWRLGGDLQLSHACTQDDNDNCSSLGSDSAEGRAELAALAKRRINHNGRSEVVRLVSASADERLFVSRSASADAESVRSVWERLAQLGIPANGAARTEVTVQAFDWQEAFDNPRRIIDLVTSKTPAVQPVFVVRKEAFDVPDYVDETHETKKIDAQRVRQFAAWAVGGEQYRLIHEDYQSGNASTSNTQYLHVLSWNPAGQVRVVDLSTRLLAEGRIRNQDDALPHLLPSDFDIVNIVAGRYLLASGHWLHDSDRWALLYDLRADKILFFNGALPNGTTTKSLSMTADGQVFIAANSSGQLYFYSVATGRQILKGYYVDDELAIYDVNAYYISTLEGSQFVFLRFPGLHGYLSFKQFAKTLNRPDIIMDTLAGKKAPAAPDLQPPPRLTLTAEAAAGTAGRLNVTVSANASRQLAKVRFYFDGQLWKELPASGFQARIDDGIDFPAQARWLSAIAVDVDGNESEPAGRQIPRDTRPSTRKLYAVAVGTDSYQNLPQDLQLHFAGYDAKNFLGALQAQKSGYYSKVEAMPFIDAPNLKTDLPKVLRTVARSATSLFGPRCQARPGQPQLCSPHSKAWRTPVIPLFGRGHSFAPALHKPALPRAGGVKDGAATTKGGLSLTAPSTVACWMPLGPRTSSMPLAGPCFSSGWTRWPSQDGMRKMKRNNLRGVLTVAHTVGTSCGAISLHPSSREGHLPPEAAETSSCVSVSRIGRRRYQAEAAFSFVHWNSVPSTQMRCMMTASLRASATIALFNPRFLAIFMAQALSHDHLTLRVITVWAPS